MDQRYLRYRYFQKVSKKTGNGWLFWDPWHRWGSYGRWVRAKARYKNIDRTTIRRWEVTEA